MILPLFGLLFGVLAGLVLNVNVSYELSRYSAVAILATTYYWETNPVLVIISWFFAFGGTGGEAKVANRAARRSER